MRLGPRSECRIRYRKLDRKAIDEPQDLKGNAFN